MVGSHHAPLMGGTIMKFIPVFGPQRLVFKLDFSVPPRPPTKEERERMRRMADAYDEAESERVLRLAFPSPPPESS